MKSSQKDYDLICVGGGIMSGTLALLMKLLDPDSKIIIFERLVEVGQESSEAWNNSGTGHSAFCELNYTPERRDGSIDVSKAIDIFSQFERSKEFWAYLIEKELISDPSFIHSAPHHSWVRGEENTTFLKKRFKALQEEFMFKSMKYSEDPDILQKWFPLIMNKRDTSQPMAATRMELGTEINFGQLTETYFNILKQQFETPVLTQHEVKNIDAGPKNDWVVEVENLKTKERQGFDADHVFIGAGGRALNLLEKVDIEEEEGYGGFPVSGQWLTCSNPEIIKQHSAKVYSKAGPNAPPMSTPHLDTRYINGAKELLFGPFAGFSTKFLKEGSYADLFESIKWDNIPSMWGAFWHNLDLIKYLIKQVEMDHEDRMDELRDFIIEANSEDWTLKVAGQRVQIIKRDNEKGGTLEFGTDVVHSKDGSISALLGASPGASTAVDIMLKVLQNAFPEKMDSSNWRNSLDKMIPFWNEKANSDEKRFKTVQKKCSRLLKLNVLH